MYTSLLIALTLAQPAPKPECHTSGLNTACGFHCRAELDQVRCAQTPEGLCENVERKLICWDPPDELRFHTPKVERATCHAKYTQVACGYGCLTSPTQLACAQTPYGVCATRFDRVQCWDPPTAVLHHLPRSELMGASCLQTDKTIACGWDCKRSYLEVQCAQSPRGKCAVFEGRLSCFDPPLPPITHEAVSR